MSYNQGYKNLAKQLVGQIFNHLEQEYTQHGDPDLVQAREEALIALCARLGCIPPGCYNDFIVTTETVAEHIREYLSDKCSVLYRRAIGDLLMEELGIPKLPEIACGNMTHVAEHIRKHFDKQPLVGLAVAVKPLLSALGISHTPVIGSTVKALADTIRDHISNIITSEPDYWLARREDGAYYAQGRHTSNAAFAYRFTARSHAAAVGTPVNVYVDDPFRK